MPAPLSPNSDETTSHPTKLAKNASQVVGYLPPAGERDAVSLREFRINRAAILPHLKIGDWLTLVLGSACVVLLALKLWSGDLADKAIIRSGGKIFKEVPLSRDQQVEVPGPLGTSVIAIRNHQARIVSDPSPRQYCVRQGWLQQSGEIAICLPNEVSVELTGSRKKYDSLNY
jgi:hypothetical protein